MSYCSYAIARDHSTAHDALLTLTMMKTQINCSFAFKRFVNANQAKVAKIPKNKHEKATRHSTFWAVNVVILGNMIIKQWSQTYDVQFILTFIYHDSFMFEVL